MSLEAIIHRASTAVRCRQRPDGSWELYGPAAPNLETVISHEMAAQRKVRVCQLLIVAELYGGIPEGSQAFYRFKRACEAVTKNYRHTLPNLVALYNEAMEVYTEAETEGRPS